MSIPEKADEARAGTRMTRRTFAKRMATLGAATLPLIGANDAAGRDGDWISDRPVQDGRFISDFALQYVGYPYVWAANGPWSFDCSGFTQFVLRNTVGIDIGHSTAQQTWYGTWVNAADLQPGDQVFFANTWDVGISHTGIYIGDYQFVHAQNPETGVCVSWLWSDYYSAHYWGAMRNW